MLKANSYQGRTMVCLSDENVKEELWCNGDTLWGVPIKYTPEIVELESWEDYENWLPEDNIVEIFSKKASISHEEWIDNL